MRKRLLFRAKEWNTWGQYPMSGGLVQVSVKSWQKKKNKQCKSNFFSGFWYSAMSKIGPMLAQRCPNWSQSEMCGWANNHPTSIITPPLGPTKGQPWLLDYNGWASTGPAQGQRWLLTLAAILGPPKAQWAKWRCTNGGGQRWANNFHAGWPMLAQHINVIWVCTFFCLGESKQLFQNGKCKLTRPVFSMQLSMFLKFFLSKTIWF